MDARGGVKLDHEFLYQDMESADFAKLSFEADKVITI